MGKLQDAVNGSENRISLEPQVYEEKISCVRDELYLTGAGADRTVILWHDGALEMQPDGFKRGTFRSYTFYFQGKKLVLKDLAIVNDAGDGRSVGQAVAAYFDGDRVYAENCEFRARQDTLFVAPLPDTEREPRGFMGPGEFLERKLTRQYFKNCRISGDVDFIFGGADAVFDDCEIICLDREHNPEFADAAKTEREESGRFVNGFITAPCGRADGLGLVFRNCVIKAGEGVAPGTYALGRPWREEGKAAFLNCVMDDIMMPIRFSGWRGFEAPEDKACFVEYGSKLPDGTPADVSGRNPWVRIADDETAAAISAAADELVKEVTEN